MQVLKQPLRTVDVHQTVADIHHQLEIFVDSLGLMRKAVLKPADVLPPVFGNIEPFLSNEHMVIPIGVDLQKLKVSGDVQPFINRPQVPTPVDLTDIMHPSAELVTFQGKGMRPTPRDFVLFTHQDFLACPGQRYCCCQPSRARSNDNCVVIRHSVLLHVDTK